MKGMTLFEMLLVLVIAGFILAFSLGQYRSLKSGADAEVLKANVNTIALATAYYYRANCAEPAVVPSATNPLWKIIPPVTGTSVPVDINTQLVTPGFLGPILPNSLVSQPGGTPYEGYTVTLNSTVTPRTVCTAGTSSACTATVTTGTVINWTINILVCLQDPTTLTLLQSLTNADSISTTSSASCTTGGALIFNFSPSALMVTSPEQAFIQMYTTMPTSYLMGTAGASNTQYYYCGS